MSDGVNIGTELIGRKTIYTSYEVIDESNIITVLNEALAIHIENMIAEDYLYWYRRGISPILYRTKQVRPEINNKVREGSGHAEEIVAFKNGYFLTQPANYISRKDDAQERVEKLNEFLYVSGKHDVDNEVVDWFHTVGKGVLMVRSTDDDEKPVEVFALDPRSAFVVYSMRPGNEPIMGVYTVVVNDEIRIDAFTKDRIYRVSGSVSGRLVTPYPNYTATAISVDRIEPNTLNAIPLVEYKYNSTNMGAFEGVLSLLDALDNLASNRLDGVEQFIQSLLVFYNCELDKDSDGNDVTPAYIRQSGALFLKSFGENKADLKEISSQLDQSQTQVLVDYVYEQIQRICALPLVNKNGHTYDTTGAAVMSSNGWYQADASARNTEDLFKKSNRRFDALFCDILRKKGLLDIKPSEFELNFIRNETSAAQSKAQTLQTLLSAGLAPELAFAKSGISNDPVSDVAMSKEYLEMVWGDPAKRNAENTTGTGEAEIIERDTFVGDDTSV